MKKNISKNLFFFFLPLFLVSCSKCVDCGECPNNVTLDDTELCEDDFDSKDDYDQAVSIIEGFGCDCK